MLVSMMTTFSVTLLNMLIASQCGAIKCPDEPQRSRGGVSTTVTTDIVPAITWAAPARTGVSEPADASSIRSWRAWRSAEQPLVTLARPGARLLRAGPSSEWLVLQDPQEVQASEDPPAGSPFLGIRYAPIPKALAAHIGTEQGVLVLNVVEGSPAEEARLQQYDVITHVGEQVAPPDAAGFIKMAQELGVGETVAFRIIRGAKPMTVDIRIGARPADSSAMKYKYESPPEEEAVSRFMFKPNFFTFDKDGKFVAPDEESLKKMHELLPQLKFDWKGDWSKLPGGAFTTCVIVRQSDDGKSVEIRRDADGRITVKRTGKDGRTDAATYDNEDALRDGDDEAYRMYKDCISEHDINIIGGLPGQPGKPHKFLDEDIEQRIKEAIEAYQKSLKGHGDTMKRLERTMRDMEKRYGVSVKARRDEGVRFERLPDGSIKVTTRRGDDEMTETFSDENSLKRERPELFERFNSLQQQRGKAAVE